MYKTRIFILAIIIAALAVAVMHAQETTAAAESEGFMEPKPVQGKLDALFWRTLVVALVAGALGGVVYELLILQGNIELPHFPKEGEASEKYPYAIVKHMFDLGIFARVFIGALAGVIILLVFSPTTILGLIAISVVAGSAGIAVFSSIQDRLLAAISQKDAADTKDKARQGKTKLAEAMTEFGAFKKTISPKVSAAEAALSQDAMAKVEMLLSEAKGALDTI